MRYRLISDRDLVGVSEGEKKRRARRARMECRYPLCGIRKFYRIGERLRPCRGCHECMPNCHACNGHRSVATTVNDQDGNAIEMPCPICCYWDPCDGSGVLPARRALAKGK